MQHDAVNLLPEFCNKRVLILGCGNVLFGDDGFGPAVIEYLVSHFEIPDDIYVMDVGTGVRKLLFTLSLSPERPEQIVIVDAIDKGKPPGKIFELTIADIPLEKKDDFSLHHAPTSNLLCELNNNGVDVCLFVCQAQHIPDYVKPGLSDVVQSAVVQMSNLIAKKFFTTIPVPEVIAK